MKFYAVLILCCAIYYVDAICTGERLTAVVDKCTSEEEATKDDFEDMLQQKKALTENAKCFRACFLQECQMMDAGGHLDRETPKEYYEIITRGDAEKIKLVDGVIQSCINATIIDGRVCTNAEQYMDCVFTNCKECGLQLHDIVHGKKEE